MLADTLHIRAGATQPGWTHQSVWISTETWWNRWVGPRESNLRYRQCNKYKPKKRQCVPNMTASELPREVRENTHQSWEDSVVPVCVFFIASLFLLLFLFYFNGKSEADRDHHNKKTRRLNWEERSVVPLFCLFVLKTSLAAESARLSEYKRCLRGNVSEVLCWWLTDKHQGWDCNSVQWVRGRREKKMFEKICIKKIHGCLSNAEKRRWKGGGLNQGSERTKKLIYIL